jgi:hydroxymethylglutaryl-CoA lyase
MSESPARDPQPHAIIVEVGPRDGFQSLSANVSTEQKFALIKRLHEAGVQRMEVTAFVSDQAVPQFRDAADLMALVDTLPGLDAQVLVPSRRHAQRALEVGVRHIAFVVSVSERHNRSNVNRSPSESIAEYVQIAADLRPDVKVRLNIATAFHCPFEGRVSVAAALSLIEEGLRPRMDVEVALCDTTGSATPDRVAALVREARAAFPGVSAWAFHGHDTYGVGIANLLAARGAGASVFDASFAGLGGCPFAPGATGNVATEDVVWTLHEMGIGTGIDLQKLLIASQLATELPGAQLGGRVRLAIAAAAANFASQG